MNKIKIISIILMLFLLIGAFQKVYAKGIKSSHSSSRSTVKSSGTKTIKGAKTSTKSYTGSKTTTTTKSYSTPKTFKSSYNSSNIKTQTVNTNPTHYSSYSSTNMFKPNFWTAMWAFKCMNDNSKEVTEQDIVKELEERGYNEDEIKEILKEGEQAKIQSNVISYFIKTINETLIKIESEKIYE